ncbi:hypothetical protein ABK040_015821 [Willaertia magna]
MMLAPVSNDNANNPVPTNNLVGNTSSTNVNNVAVKPKKELHEIELWLCSKLNNDWSSERVASQITEEVLELFITDEQHHNYENFFNLGVSNSPLIKLRFIMSCISMKKKQMSPSLVTNFCTLFKNIIENKHEDEWVRMMAEILYLYPEYCCLRTDVQKSVLEELNLTNNNNNDAMVDDNEETPKSYFQQAIKYFYEKAATNNNNRKAILRPTIAKYLNTSSEAELKDFNQRKHLLESFVNYPNNAPIEQDKVLNNKHFKLKSAAYKQLLDPLTYLDELENESNKKSSTVTPSPLKKVMPTQPQRPLSGSGSGNNNVSTPTSAMKRFPTTPSSANNVNNNRKMIGGVTPGLHTPQPTKPKTTMLTNTVLLPPHHNPLISPTATPTTPRSVFLDDTTALNKIKEQEAKEKGRRSSKALTDEQKQKEKERKRLERQEAKEKKEREKLEKKKQKEEMKKKLQEERKAAQQQAGGAGGTTRKRRKNNPANQQNQDHNTNMQPGEMVIEPNSGMQNQSHVNNPNMTQIPPHAHTNPPSHMYNTTLLNPPVAGNQNNFFQNGGLFPNATHANTFGAPFNTPPSANQFPNMAFLNHPFLSGNNTTPNNKGVDQSTTTSFTQLLGLSSMAPNQQNNPNANARGQPNLLPPFGAGNFPMMFNDGTMPNNPNQFNMFLRQNNGMVQTANGNTPIPNQQNINFMGNTNLQQAVPPQQNQQVPQPQLTEEERLQRLEGFLKNNILKDCNRVTEDTKRKIIQFLSGSMKMSGPLEDKVLIHEEIDDQEKRQIYFQMDHTNRKWKKIMQKHSLQQLPPFLTEDDAGSSMQ